MKKSNLQEIQRQILRAMADDGYEDQQRLRNLAAELAVAASQVLARDFGFTPAQLRQFSDAWLAQAQRNRDGEA